MSIERISWAVTVVLFLIAAVIGIAVGYQGYGALAAAVAAAAAINLL
jgi:hypothetical protein